MVIHDTNNRAYKKAKESKKDWLTRLLKICLKRIGTLREWREEVDENKHTEATNKMEQVTKKRRKTKKRRLMKDLQILEQGEHRFKGWSDEVIKPTKPQQ